MMQRTLPTDRDHDLPPRWDGNPVEWDGWTNPPTIHLCPPPRRPAPCPACGSTEPPVTNRGRVLTRPGVYDKWGRQRQDAGRLQAYRCVDCRHDHVISWADGWQVWDLDESDYTDTGSRAR